MEQNLINFKSREFLFSLIYIPIFTFVSLIKGQNELIFAVISCILILSLLILLIKLSINIKLEETKTKFKSFFRFVIFNVIILLVFILISTFLIKNCTGGLCGLSEAESILIFVLVQISVLLVYGVSLILVDLFTKNK